MWNIQRKLQPQFLIISENISEVTALKKFFLQFLELLWMKKMLIS